MATRERPANPFELMMARFVAINALLMFGWAAAFGQAHSQNAAQDQQKEAMKYLEDARAGNTPAMSLIAEKYRNGDGVPQSYLDSFLWYKKAAENGNSLAMVSVGHMYEEGQGVSRSYPDAMMWFHKAAANGDGEAQYMVGFLYQNGMGVPQSYPEAAKWYAKAVNNHSEIAAVSLGALYQTGLGVPLDCPKAKELYVGAMASRDPKLATIAHQLFGKLECSTSDEQLLFQLLSDGSSTAKSDVTSSDLAIPTVIPPTNAKVEPKTGLEIVMDLMIWLAEHKVSVNIPSSDQPKDFKQQYCDRRAVAGLFGTPDKAEGELYGCREPLF